MLHRRFSGPLIAVLLLLGTGALLWRADALGWLTASLISAQAGPTTLPAGFSEVVLPFELVNEHIFLAAQVGNSHPLQFMLDSGNKLSIIYMDVAQRSGLTLGSDIQATGMGSQPTRAAFVKNSRFTLAGFPGFSQPVSLALSLQGLTPRLGHNLDGILGSDFIEQFVVELDYQRHTLTLHNRDTFHYSGAGESVSIGLTSSGHPVLQAAVTPVGGEEISADFEVDIGASGALELHSPFVAAHNLPAPGARTVPDLGAAGVGGETRGDIGRAAAFRIGSSTLRNPFVVFSRDTAGNAAGSATQGNIGEEILSRFKLFFDYAHHRIIFERNPTFADPFDRAFSGLRVEAEGPDYRVFRVKAIAPNSSGAAAGLQLNDVITEAAGIPAPSFTYAVLLDRLRRPDPLALAVERGGKTLAVALTPRQLE